MAADGALAVLVALAFPVAILLLGAPFVIIGHLVAALIHRF